MSKFKKGQKVMVVDDSLVEFGWSGKVKQLDMDLTGEVVFVEFKKGESVWLPYKSLCAVITLSLEEAYDEATSEKRMAEIGQNGNTGEHYDAVNHPKHYTSHPSGVECIDITQHMGFCLGNAIKYIWRADLKNDAVEDLNKAKWYIDQELKKRAEKTPEIQPFGHPLADD